MVRFIKQEAEEKANEIMVSAEEVCASLLVHLQLKWRSEKLADRKIEKPGSIVFTTGDQGLRVVRVPCS
jgi:hypothetical protein